MRIIRVPMNLCVHSVNEIYNVDTAEKCYKTKCLNVLSFVVILNIDFELAYRFLLHNT